MLKRILDDRQETLLKEERGCLGDLRVALARFDASSEHQVTLERSIQQLDEFFLLVVIGEFNSVRARSSTRCSARPSFVRASLRRLSG